MVKKIIFVLVMLSLLSMNALSKNISKIEISESGSIYDGEDNKYEKEACKKFVPNKNQLINYFKLAEESNENKWLHDYYSACISYGNVQFEDGFSGKWTIQSSGLGYVIPDNGSPVYFFYKDNKWEDPNAYTYGLGDEPESDPGC